MVGAAHEAGLSDTSYVSSKRFLSSPGMVSGHVSKRGVLIRKVSLSSAHSLIVERLMRVFLLVPDQI
ncbi:hypothetical protein DOO74_20635 [Rhodobacteraceae bacterium AsT-22]|nr:hypothetical protein DOO74_20635 [Rhodobacteraceae bacterium AsT-22]